MAMALNGAPGILTGTDLTHRIGMPERFFRKPRDGIDPGNAGREYMKKLLGPSIGWALGSVPQGLT